jgi:tRNA(Ile)-lysidine synthase
MELWSKDGIMMLSKAWDCIKLNNMIEKGDRIVVGVSGGADSVCLLYVLEAFCRGCGAHLTTVHINHGIRGEEAEQDEQFVKELCRGLKIDFCSFYYPVKEIAKELGLSEEEAGRKIRYETFLEICKSRKCNKIAVAHNRNDNAETVLFNLFRGTGIKGLSGIESKRSILTEVGEIILIRPLLYIERKEIEDYLQQRNITWQTDSTNLHEDYSRNKIRNKILAYAVKEINSGATCNITETASQLREAGDFIEAEVCKAYLSLVDESEGCLRIPINEFLTKHLVIQKGIIMKMLEKLSGKRKDIEAKHIQAVLSLFEKQVGRLIHLPYEIIAEKEYEQIKLFCVARDRNNVVRIAPDSIRVGTSGETLIPWKAKICETVLINYKNNITIPKSSCVKWFDYDKIENAVTIRTRREGDFIQINSSGGNKKLKDYFIDQKIPQRLRDRILLVADGSHIMWIVGEWDRMSERYKVDETTQRVLIMKMFDLEESVDDR